MIKKELRKIAAAIYKKIASEIQREMDSRPVVHGADIYIQDTEPDVEGDYVWINTSIDHINQ